MNLPPEANVALVDLMGAFGRYHDAMHALAITEIDPPHPAFDRCEAYIRDAEQALIKILTAVLGEPDAA